MLILDPLGLMISLLLFQFIQDEMDNMLVVFMHMDMLEVVIQVGR
jgi:hypothetical protein